jgi:fructokinase
MDPALFLDEGPAPVVRGTGFIALDLILTGSSPVLHAGGSCGNILTILSYLGWRSVPVANLADGWMADRIRGDMERFGVDTGMARSGPGGSTPLVVEVPLDSPGGTHRFLDRYPDTGEKMPAYRSLLSPIATKLARRHASADFFYTDMSSRAAVILVNACRMGNARIFFEPKSTRYPKTFHECLALADIVKYSAGEPVFPQAVSRSGAGLIVETRGIQGLRYRAGGDHWRAQEAFAVGGVVDTAGAGDWCSAGIMHSLRGIRPPWERDRVEEALRFGQALAALTCKFPGARGPLYALSREEFGDGVMSILHDGDWEAPRREPASFPDDDAESLARAIGICPPGIPVAR